MLPPSLPPPRFPFWLCAFCCLGASLPALAQGNWGLYVDSGVSLARPRLHPPVAGPSALRPRIGAGAGFAYRLTYRCADRRWGLGIEQRIAGLQYRVRGMTGSQTAGNAQTTYWYSGLAHQLGIFALRHFPLGARWELSPGLGLSSSLSTTLEPRVKGADAANYNALVLTGGEREQQLSSWVNVELRALYWLHARHAITLSALYQRGLLPLVTEHTARFEHLAPDGSGQQFGMRIRGSVALINLGYEFRLWQPQPVPARRWTTPRYSIEPSTLDADENLGDDDGPTDE